jgi:hypothetical protein
LQMFLHDTGFAGTVRGALRLCTLEKDAFKIMAGA